MAGAPSLSVVIIALNEERDLPDCLRSAAFADEVVVVVDSKSGDGTEAVARKMGAKVLVHAYEGEGAQRELGREAATGDWVLSLDADERVSEELALEIREAIGRPTADAYKLRFQTYWLGRMMRFGGFRGERHLRLFRRSAGRFADWLIHPGVKVDGRVGRLEGPVRHYPYDSVEEYAEKMQRYSHIAAQDRGRAGATFSPWSVFRFPWSFFKRYVFWLGMLDGYPGFLNALLWAYYDFFKYAKLLDFGRSEAARKLK